MWNDTQQSGTNRVIEADISIDGRYYMCDFETLTHIPTRVWAYAFCDVSLDPRMLTRGTNLDGWLAYLHSLPAQSIVYFHNLRFDGTFIIPYLFEQGYKWVEHEHNPREMPRNSFSTLISDMGQWYEVVIKLSNYHVIKIRDSFKLLRMPVAAMAKAFNLPMYKGDLNYNLYRSKTHELTDEEISYIDRDVKIVAISLAHLFKQGLTNMTIGSCAMKMFKTTCDFKELYPELAPGIDRYCRNSYRGGWCFVNPIWRGKEIRVPGFVLDENSAYPWAMRENELPYGEPIYYEGEAALLDTLYIQRITCSFELKRGHFPFIQLRNNAYFQPNQYPKTCSNAVELTLTNIDLEMFLENYDVYNLTYIDGYYFNSNKGVFNTYIDTYMKMKIDNNDNKPLRTIAKLMLNNLGGKFATSSAQYEYVPVLTEDNKIAYTLTPCEPGKTVYVPVAAFMTAYARRRIVKTAELFGDRFCYSDTDSVHVIGDGMPSAVEVDSLKLGYWDREFDFKEACYHAQKTYIEIGADEVSLKACGLPGRNAAEIKDHMDVEDLKTLKVEGVLKTRKTRHGTILRNTTFEIKERVW